MSQQYMLVSREHIQQVKRLYKIIFQLHKSLPDELRILGNGYVRNEFKLHKNAKPEQVNMFMSEWSNYALTLTKQVNPMYNDKLGQNLKVENLEQFNSDQVVQLYELFQESTKAKRVQHAIKQSNDS